MKLHAKRVIILVSDGVSLEEFYGFKLGLEAEYAAVYVTSLKGVRKVRGIGSHGNEEWVHADFPVEMVLADQYDAAAIPGGVLSVDLLRKDALVRDLLISFHAAGKPMFVSQNARILLYESGVFPENILIYDAEATSVEQFVRDSCELLLEGSLRFGGRSS
jgi:putative intracellular protease/amidase